MPTLPFESFVPDLPADAFVAPGAMVIGRVKAGPDSSFWYNVVVRGDVCPIVVGARTNIQDMSVVHVTSGRFSTTIGDDVTVGHRAVLHGCVVENAALIGMGAIVLDGAVIGTESIVGAGAVVTPGTKIPPRSLALGSPARVVRPLRDEEVEGLYRSAAGYVALSRQHSVSLAGGAQP